MPWSGAEAAVSVFLYVSCAETGQLQEQLEWVKVEDRMKPQPRWSWGSQDSEVPPYNSNLNNQKKF